VTGRRGLSPAFLLLALVSAVTVSASPFQGAPSDQQVLIQLERDWDEAFHHKDVAFIATVLADEFRVTYSDGSQGDKARELKLAAEFNQQVDSSTMDDFTVRVYGDTAVVWFSEHLVGPSKGRQLAITLRFMDVFVMRDGRWQCVSSQSTKVTEP
jgi:ketosteroid isomerase-like protein